MCQTLSGKRLGGYSVQWRVQRLHCHLNYILLLFLLGQSIIFLLLFITAFKYSELCKSLWKCLTWICLPKTSNPSACVAHLDRSSESCPQCFPMSLHIDRSSQQLGKHIDFPSASSERCRREAKLKQPGGTSVSRRRAGSCAQRC